VVELLVLGFLGFVAFAVLGLFASAIAVVCWVLTLPFRLIALSFQGLGALLALPFLALFGVIAVVIFGFAAIAFLLPALPIVLAAALIWWIFARRPPVARV
jgi:hypothetical protein